MERPLTEQTNRLRSDRRSELQQRCAIGAAEEQFFAQRFRLVIERHSGDRFRDRVRGGVARGVEVAEVGIDLVAQLFLDLAGIGEAAEVARDPSRELRELRLDDGEGRAERHLEIGGDEQRALVDEDVVFLFAMREREVRGFPVGLRAADLRRLQEAREFGIFFAVFQTSGSDVLIGALEPVANHERGPRRDLVPPVGAIGRAIGQVTRILAPLLNRPAGDAEALAELIPGAREAARGRELAADAGLREQGALAAGQGLTRLQLADGIGDFLVLKTSEVFGREFHAPARASTLSRFWRKQFVHRNAEDLGDARDFHIAQRAGAPLDASDDVAREFQASDLAFGSEGDLRPPSV